MNEYTPQLLSTQELVDVYWGQCVPLLQRNVEATQGEFTVEDLYDNCLTGKMIGLVFKREAGECPEVGLVIVMELVYYPRHTALNIVSIGGKHLENMFFAKHWEDLKGWARINGVSRFECSAIPAMGRILSKYGFSFTYTQLKFELGDTRNVQG